MNWMRVAGDLKAAAIRERRQWDEWPETGDRFPRDPDYTAAKVMEALSDALILGRDACDP